MGVGVGVGEDKAVAGPEQGAHVEAELPSQHPEEGAEEGGRGGVVGVRAVPQEAERGGGVAV